MSCRSPISDVHVLDTAVLPSPEYLCRRIARPEHLGAFVAEQREQIRACLFGDDPRFLLIVGPCSIHDTKAGHEFATRLAQLSSRVEERIKLVMRVYFEKPRTTVGWKGLIMDPDLDGSADLPRGLETARQFLIDVLALGLPTATELLDPITPQYIADLICWSAIGARTSESQTHRQMASGLSMPLGFKNGTGGDVQLAVNAIRAAGQSQTFLGISQQGLASAVTTRGNPNCHLILRGGSKGPNYAPEFVQAAADLHQKAELKPAIMIDASHANSGKDPAGQPAVLKSALQQFQEPDSPVIGAMLESFLLPGKQAFPQPKEQLRYGLSITDGCLSWEETEALILAAAEALG